MAASIAAIAVAVLMLPTTAFGQPTHTILEKAQDKLGGLDRVGHPAPNTDSRAASISGGPTGVRAVPLTNTGSRSAIAGGAGPLLTTSPRLLGSFNGLTQVRSGGFNPADTQVAMGSPYVFELVNERARITSTSGATVYSAFTTQHFFGLASTDNVGDVQVMYDNLTARWFFSADDFTTNVVYFAVSKNSSPIGSYYTYTFIASFRNGAQFMDQPVLGMSRTLVGWGTNQFNTTTFAFYGSILGVFNKHKLETGVFSAQGLGLTYLSTHPARQTWGNGSGTDVLYAASTETASGSNTLAVVEVHGAIGSLSLSTVLYNIAFTGTVPGGTQPGTSILVNSGDDRVQSIGWNSGTLWVSFSTACYPSGNVTVHACIRVDAISTRINSLRQDTDTGVAGIDLFYGALAPTRSGVGYMMVLGFSGPLSYPSIALTGQNDSDFFGTFRGPIPVWSGSYADTSGRFGDYSGLQVQFAGGKNTAWGASEYDASNGWATTVVHFSFF